MPDGRPTSVDIDRTIWCLVGPFDDDPRAHLMSPLFLASCPMVMHAVCASFATEEVPMFVDYAGTTMQVVDVATGEVQSAQLFVALLGASSYSHAVATWTHTRAHGAFLHLWMTSITPRVQSTS